MLSNANPLASYGIKTTSSRIKFSQNRVSVKPSVMKEALLKIIMNMNDIKSEFSELRSTVRNIELFKRQACNNILNLSFEYERYINDQKFKIEDMQDVIDKNVKESELKQERAAEMLSEKLDQIASLNKQLQSANSISESVKKAKKAQDEDITRTRSSYEQEISNLNIKINDLLVIIHQKTQRIQTLENEFRKIQNIMPTQLPVPVMEVISENIQNIEPKKKSRCHFSFSQEKENIADTGKCSNKRKHILKKPLDLASSELTIFTTSKDSNQDSYRSKHGDSEILAKLQKFVNDLTSSKDNNSSKKNYQCIKTLQKEQFKFTPRLQWSQTLRKNDHQRRLSGQFTLHK